MRNKLSMFVIPLLGLLKRCLISIAMLGMLTIQAIAAEKGAFKVSISPAVQEQIQKVSPNERKKLEAAISAGNKFIPYHYDGRAYAVGDSGIKEEWIFWLKNIRPLISKDLSEWYIKALSIPSSHQMLIDGNPDKPAPTWLSVCPKIELVSIIAAEGHLNGVWKEWYPKDFYKEDFLFEYRAKIIGDMEDLGVVPRFFQAANNDAFETVLVSLDKNNKVSQVASHEARRTGTAESQIGILTLYISGVWSGLTPTDSRAQLERMIQDIKSQKNKICKDVPTASNQQSIKE